MDNSSGKRSVKVLCWNIRGLNSDDKWKAIRSKVNECNCDIICLQETKRELFDQQYIKNFCPSQFDNFEFLPSVGASGGIITIWKGTHFEGHLVFQNNYMISVQMACKFSGEAWILSNVYAPCTAEGKMDFLNWFKHVDMDNGSNLLIVGDFNLLRGPKNRNKPGGNFAEMLAFNNAISRQRLVEIPLKGCKYTWTNKQHSPLLERLDWFFSSNSWTTSFPNTTALALSRDTSDHTPCVISAITKTPSPRVFRFENFWLKHSSFINVMQHGWGLPVTPSDNARALGAKFKNLRRVLRMWQKQLPSIAKTIQNCKEVISFMDILEEARDLTLEEWNFRDQTNQQLNSLLSQQKIYWQQRGMIKKG